SPIQSPNTETSPERTNISRKVTRVDAIPPQPKPRSRAHYLKYSHQITLDPNTAHIRLLLSEENRKVTLMEQPQSYSHDQKRFIRWLQVLSKESFTGRCYWEVERRGTFVFVAVAYKNISRSGDEGGFGLNDKSWALNCSPNSFSFLHNNIQTFISAPVSSKVGVYLDHRAGVLSFYSVSKSMTLLHRVQTTFTQPLHAGLGLFRFVGATAEFCKLK
uniref:B30.2/SPRY domain-containing protein n=1 Tax=Oryzias melastigma TaxID=30732 RepID=A0A3B3CS63_ORYME